jgi:Flp pilus assembly protein TadG
MTTHQLKRRRQRGNAIIEFAIGAGVLMAAFTGIFEFGYSFYIYNNIQTAVNNGAKYAALKTYEMTGNTPSSCFQTAVQDMVAYGNPNPGSNPVAVAPGLTPAKVFVNVTMTNGVPTQMNVGVTNFTIDAVMAKIALSNKPQVTYPYLGRFSPGETCAP